MGLRDDRPDLEHVRDHRSHRLAPAVVGSACRGPPRYQFDRDSLRNLTVSLPNPVLIVLVGFIRRARKSRRLAVEPDVGQRRQLDARRGRPGRRDDGWHSRAHRRAWLGGLTGAMVLWAAEVVAGQVRGSMGDRRHAAVGPHRRSTCRGANRPNRPDASRDTHEYPVAGRRHGRRNGSRPATQATLRGNRNPHHW